MERLVNLMVMLLETPRPVTAQEIHETIPGYGQDQWDSFKRMFERDKEDLRDMGIPVELAPTDAWEIEEGYRIPKDRYYLPELAFEDDEVAAIGLATGLLRLNDPSAARAALMKLGSELPDAFGQPTLSADLSLDQPNIPKAFEAVSERKVVTFIYAGRSAEARRTLDPYGLVHRKGAWYLIGRDHLSDTQRSFRLDRFKGDLNMVDPGHPGPEFDIPEGFRPGDVLERPLFMTQEGPITVARVRFDQSMAWWMERGSPWITLEWQSDGSAEAEIEVRDEQGFISWLLWFGEGAYLLSPQPLIEALIERLEKSA